MELNRLLIGIGLVGSLMFAGQANASFIIDDFNTAPPTQVVSDGAPGDSMAGIQGTGNSLLTNITAGNIVLNALGGAAGWTRTIIAELDFGDNVSTEVCSFCQTGHLVSGAGGGIGNSSFVYQGPSLDFGKASAVTFDYAADNDGAVVQFTFSDGINPNVTVASAALANTSGSSAPANLTGVSIALPSFGGLPGFSDIVAVRVDILGVADLDFSIDNITVVPEPSSIALMGLGLVGLGWRARRRRKSA